MKLNHSISLLLGLGLLSASGQEAATAVIYDTPSAIGIGVTPPTGSLTLPLQTIDATAAGPGAVDAAHLEGMSGLFINTQWQDASGTRFAQVGPEGNESRNYLAFRTPNENGIRSAIKFDFNAGGIGDQFAGGYNSTGPRIVIAGGNSIFLGAALVTEQGKMEITFGTHEGGGTTEDGITFITESGDNESYAVRGVGFIISGAATGTTTTVALYGVKGQLLSTLESTSPGETTTGENAAGGELFFGYDAGEDPMSWVHRIVIDGDTGGNAGLDDFSFTPVAAVRTGPPTPTAVIYDTEPAVGIGVTPPTAPYTAPLQTVDATAIGTGAVDQVVLEALEGLFINTHWKDGAGTAFAPKGTENNLTRNYLAFTSPNANGVPTAIRFAFNAGGIDDPFAGGFNDNGPRIVVSAGNSIFLSAALATESGQYEITFGSHEGSGTTESDITFFTGPDASNVYAVRGVGFIISGAALGTTTTARYYGVKGQLLNTLDATSPGETTGGENAAGGELFFGYDAGEETAQWVHKIVIDGDTGGNAGFDDFAFTPVAAVPINIVGDNYAQFPVYDGYINVPHMGWVYVLDNPWLYVLEAGNWIFAPEDLFTEGGVWYYGIK